MTPEADGGAVVPGPFDRRHLGAVMAVAGLLVVFTILLEVPAVRQLAPRGPTAWARRNSEAWTAAALLLVDLWWIPRRLSSRGWQAWWACLLALAVLTAVVGPAVGASDRLVTLQESFIAVAALSLLLRWGNQGARRRTALFLATMLAALAVLVAAASTVRLSALGQLVVGQAETVALAVLAVALVVGVHHWPVRVGAPWLRGLYLAGLVVAPIGFAMVHRVEPGGVRFAQRTTESFLAVLIVGVVVELLALSAGRPVSRPPSTGGG